ncbi:homoserine O-acetyltransferase [Moraxella caviae]|uniref:Homoserine O-succinyltransferase n=1 Tax=Moraxella caviae TaxID=34060 RepID=A0A1T0ACI1_9GAMM|nr:homoserine O-acetyltransferase [Moraxella caviae]OOR93426.1 homoserine O-acetyltransferase [Moraxella caviae]STZ14084.1 Homoserine O-acetyltransferase [Moraxella caviae]VEW11155.1 Homoserine O-acetyltransferase [Moraxella caviae]
MQTSTPPYQDPSSVGIVTPTLIHFDTPLLLECERTLPSFDLMVETYGELNADKSNAILICHALSGSHHAAGFHSEHDAKAGWWDALIGKGKAIDTEKFFVVCLNNIGSCHGSTGPTTINPETNDIWGADFPLITIKDWVKTQVMLSDYLGIKRWHAIVGGSMGGMQALQWSVDYPERLARAVIIASTPKISAQNIAFNEVARQSILSDPDFHQGWYLKHGTYPRRGLMLARMLGHITYITEDAMKAKFGRDLKSGKFMYGYDVEFEVESYLRYQGERFSKNFDANTYLLMTKALDYFDPTRDYADPSLSDAEALKATLARTQCQFLVVSFTTDWRFSPERSVELTDALMANQKPVSFINVDAPHGHDSFLFAIDRYVNAIKGFLGAPFVAKTVSGKTLSPTAIAQLAHDKPTAEQASNS